MSLSSFDSAISAAADALFSTAADRQTQMSSLAQTALSTGADRFTKGDYNGAVREFKRAIALDPTPDSAAKAYNLLATVYIQQGKTDDAVKAYKTSIRMNSSDDNAHLKLGNIYFDRKQYASAEAEYKSAVKLNPTSSTNLFSLGQAYLATDRTREAENTFKRVIQMDPGQYGGHYALGQTYSKAGRTQEAIAEFNKVIRLKKDFTTVHVDLGYAYTDLGQTDNAQAELKILNTKAPSQASLLSNYIDRTAKPKMLAAYTISGFAVSDGPNTQVSALDASLSTPGASHQFNMVIIFDKSMDANSVQSVNNWSIRKADSSTLGGPYNWGMPKPTTDISIAPIPLSVVYNPDSRSATVSFRITQNAYASGTIDPSHIQFKFIGKDSYGNTVDKSADEYGGISKIV